MDPGLAAGDWGRAQQPLADQVCSAIAGVGHVQQGRGHICQHSKAPCGTHAYSRMTLLAGFEVVRVIRGGPRDEEVWGLTFQRPPCTRGYSLMLILPGIGGGKGTRNNFYGGCEEIPA